MPFPSLPSPPTPFPTYLVPSLPFRRRRQSSTDSTGSCTSTTSSSSSSSICPPPSIPQSYLPSSTSHLRCNRCLSDLALSTQIISKGFTGRHGRAYLVSPTLSPHPASPPPDNTTTTPRSRTDALPNLPNTYTHKPVPRQLVTGAHTVGDISCAHCGSVLGWKYVSAEDDGQKYKVGKFILETKRVCRTSDWLCEEGVPRSAAAAAAGGGVEGHGEDEDVEFDSQDEEECDALFAGQWTVRFARESRRRRMGRSLRKLEE